MPVRTATVRFGQSCPLANSFPAAVHCALHHAGDFSGALVKFQSAYEQSKDPRLLWDAAVASKALHHYAKALLFVHRFLDSASPLITPEAAQHAVAFLGAAEPLTAFVEITGSENGAVVSIDGEVVGETPLAQPLRVDIGTHQIVLKKAHFNDWSTSATITTSKPLQLRAALTAIVRQGRFVIRASRGDAIAVDGSVVAVGEWEGLLPAGHHAVRVTARGARPFASDVIVEPDQMQTLDVKLETNGWAGIPTWGWIAGGAVLAVGAATAAYFVFKPSDRTSPPIDGTAATVQLPLR